MRRMRGRVRQFRKKFRSNIANKDIFRDANYNFNGYVSKQYRIRGNVERLQGAIDEQRRYATSGSEPVQWLTLLMLLAPSAAQAQQQIDKHPHGFHDKQARIYDLIDFNDTYVATVLSLDKQHLQMFNKHLKIALDAACLRVGVRPFSDEQFEAITRGLTREIAVFRSALALGYEARMTSRREDAMGVDMVVREPESGLQVNLDIKSPSSYRYRLQDLVREGRMSEEELVQADIKGYAHEVNGHGGEAVDVVLMRIDANEVGEIVDFEFEEPLKLDMRIKEILSYEDRRYER